MRDQFATSTESRMNAIETHNSTAPQRAKVASEATTNWPMRQGKGQICRHTKTETHKSETNGTRRRHKQKTEAADQQKNENKNTLTLT